MGTLRPDPGFVGRGDEVARLAEVLRTARDGGSPLSLVLGEAGVGKSRLADRVAADARALGYDVLWTEAEEGGGPFSALAGLRLPGAADPAGDGAGDDQRWDRLEAVAAGIAARAPVLVIVEDLHWADASSLWVLERLARHLGEVAAPVLGTARHDEATQPPMARLTAAADHVVRLGGLSVEETTRLAELAAPGGSVDGAALWERTGGIPLFVREAAVLAAEGGAPELATGVLRRRFERLGEATCRVLAAVALAPVGTSLVTLARALDRTVEAVVAAVDTARAEDLVVDERGGGVRFRHALLTAAAAATLPTAEQRRLRLALADALDAEATVPSRGHAAHQRLLALPAGDLDATAASALAAVTETRAAGHPSEASALAAVALSELEPYGAAAPVMGGLHVELGELLLDFREVDRAREAFEAAVALGDALEPTLRARAETGRSFFVNPLVPQSESFERLTRAAAALPPGDSALRVRLMGRIAATSIAGPLARERGRSAGQEAVAMARRLGDPALLVQALADLHLAPTTPDEWVARGDAAEEIVALGERLGRPEVALLGYEWQFGERLGRADRHGAEESLGRLELYAQLSPSPKWRIAAGLRRAVLTCLAGDREGALRVLDTEFLSARQWLHQEELSGIAVGFRTAAALQHGVDDPVLREQYDSLAEAAGQIPAPFIQASLALTAWVIGEEELARRHLGRAAAALDVLAVGLESLYGLTCCGLVAGALGDERLARDIRPLLEPHAGRLTAGSSGMIVPTATAVGVLADATGDAEAAASYHDLGIELAERVGSAVLAARCRELAGRSAPASEPAAAPGVATVARATDGWAFNTPFGGATVEESRGLLQLVEVLRAGGRELAAVDLAAGGGTPVVQHDLGPMLDDRAKREYRARIAELREEIDDAEAMNDPDRGTRARLELDALLEELGRAVGMGGRDRPHGATDERARVNVTRSIRRAIAAVAAQAPELGAHLEVSVRTGRECSYRPDPAAALAWEVRPGG